MKIIYNKFIPFKGFVAINLFGFIFARKEYKPLSTRVINHEAIHSAQMKELLYIGFYLLYLLEWITRVFISKNAYRNISFEREAYENETNSKYSSSRRRFGWTKYVFKRL